MTLLSLMSMVGDIFHVRHLVDKCVIDDKIFRAHYKVTTALFFSFCVLVTAGNLIGEPINCVADNSHLYNIINTYCWITTTFTLPNKVNAEVGTHVSQPGVSSIDDYDDIRYHSYYQWVAYVLFFQGVMFYIPHWVWKIWEEGRVQMMTEGIRGFIVGQNEEKSFVKSQLVNYLICNLNMHNTYAFVYFSCEVLNLVNVITNIIFINRFLGGEFFTYGLKVIQFNLMDQEDRIDPMVAIFPRITKCKFNYYGPSGTIQLHDALCVLAINNLNEKIYIVLWFWLIILAIISSYAVLYSISLCLVPNFRRFILYRRFKFGTRKSIKKLINKLQIGDFLFIHLLGQNMDNMNFNEMINELCSKLSLSDN